MEEEITILKGDYVKITCKNKIYEIKFKFAAYSLINSLLKTRIINGGSTDDTYKSITFKASSVETLEQYQKYKTIIHGTKNLLVSDVAKMVRTLSMQLNYLIENESSTILGYHPADIIVINDEKFAFIGSELVAKIDSEGEGMATISCPFSAKDFFVSPELLNIKEIPSKVHFKTAYFSLGLLLIYMLLADDEFYIDYLKHKHSGKIINSLNNHPIKDTRIFWLLSRCLVEDPKKRSIILI
jgi:hypothetical protein